jgi:nitrogenase-stabilizing/protective protein
MSAIEELSRLSSAEDFFVFLDVPYDPAIVRFARLHILRRMGQYIKGSELDGVFDELSEAEVRAMCRGHLEQAYQDFVESSPIQERLFKVHKEAVAPKPQSEKPLVTIGAFAAPAKGS